MRLYDLLYTKLWPRMDRKQGLEGQVSKTDSSRPSSCSQNGSLRQNTGTLNEGVTA